MKANELMIGDWVQNSLRAKGWIKNIRLFPKESDGFGGYYIIDIAYSADGKSYARVEEKDIEPIPLTAEILEKNGLRKVTLDGEKGSKQDYYIDTHVVGYYNMDAFTRVHASPIVYDIKQKWLFADDKAECRIEMWCPYVHNLQHALRLCGITHEIVL